MAVNSQEDRDFAIQLLKTDESLTEDQQVLLMDRIEAFDAQQTPAPQQEAPASPEVPEELSTLDKLGLAKDFTQALFRSKTTDKAKDAVAVGEFGLTMATGGLAEIGAGSIGAAQMALGASNDTAAQSIETLSDFFTYTAKTERGQKLLQDIAAPLEKLESGADRLSETLGGGNPAAQTAIKTILLGGAELVLPVKGAKARILSKKALRDQQAQVKQVADNLGINPRIEDIDQGILDAAAKMLPEERAANAAQLTEAMKNANEAARADKNAKFEIAKNTPAFVETRSVRRLGQDIQDNLLEQGFDIEDMPKVQKRLADLEAGPFESGRSLAADLNSFEMVRKRINKNTSADGAENAALKSMRRSMDEFLDNQFNNAAISGDPTAVQAWKDARTANASWKQNFNADKVVKQLVEKDSTPEQYRQWIMGASNMNARKEAASTIARMKEVLGESHPAIEGIRQDFLYEIAEPLMQETPNFRAFVKNYDTTIRRNPSLVKELGLDNSQLRPLYDFSRVQVRLPPNKNVTMTDITRGLSQFLAGNKLAKATLRVNLFRNLANKFLGVDRVTKKQILKEIQGVMFDEPAIPRGSDLAADFIVGAALTSIPDAQEKAERQ